MAELAQTTESRLELETIRNLPRIPDPGDELSWLLDGIRRSVTGPDGKQVNILIPPDTHTDLIRDTIYTPFGLF